MQLWSDIDLRDIERIRDEPPDEPYPDRDEEEVDDDE